MNSDNVSQILLIVGNYMVAQEAPEGLSDS